MRDVPLRTTGPPNSTAGQPPSRPAQNAADSSEVQGATDSNTPWPSNSTYTLAFQYTPGLIQLPAGVADKYFQVVNITLQQLPQARTQTQITTANGSRGRQLLQAAGPAAGSVEASSNGIDPGVLTILLWPFNRYVAHTRHQQLMPSTTIRGVCVDSLGAVLLMTG